MLLDGNAALILLAALVLDALIGDPDWLWRRAPHPVTAMGQLIDLLERTLNRTAWSGAQRRASGVATVGLIATLATGAGWAIHLATREVPFATVIDVALVAVLLAQRSLYDHVDHVRVAFATGGLAAARTAVSRIVGRDPEPLDQAGVCRAAIESTAENFSDGVVAPAFWYLIFGLPGIVAYKMINTADSMIGHRNERYLAFGWAAARLDDVVNLIPARLSALLFAISAPLAGGSFGHAFRAVCFDAGHHRSPNAGWPEAAVAGALGLALAGPRIYADKAVEDRWMNADGRQDATPNDITRALRLLIAAAALHMGVVAIAALLVT